MAILYTSERDNSLNRYENRVIRVELNQTIQIMSDIWAGADFALVWDDAENTPKRLCVNVYDMQPADWKPAKIIADATPETREKYRSWLIGNSYRRMLEDAEYEARQIKKGCIAKVVKGKNGKGTEGPVVVQMLATYGMGWRASSEYKLAIATSDVKVKKALRNGKVAEVYQDVVWVWQRNAVRVDIAPVDKDAILAQATEAIDRQYTDLRPALQRAA